MYGIEIDWWSFSLATSLLIVIYYAFSWNNRIKTIPGPRTLPFIGNIHQLDTQKVHETLRCWAKQYGEIYKFNIFGQEMVVVNSEKGIREMLIFKSTDFAGRASSFRVNYFLKGSDIVLGSFSPQWAHMKRVTMSGLKMVGDGVKRLEEISMDIIEDVVKEMEGHNEQPFDYREIIHHSVASITASLVRVI